MENRISVIPLDERAELLSSMQKALKKELFETGLRLELVQRGALYPAELPYTELIGILIKHVRWAKGINEAELARRSGVRAETISRLEHGKQKPQRETVFKLAEALEVPPEQLDPDKVFWSSPGYAEEAAREMREFVEKEKERIEQEKQEEEQART